jgi:hypothetical protein
MAKTGRNDPCNCGSGKKYKRCCLEKDEAAASAARAEARAQGDLALGGHQHKCPCCGGKAYSAGFVHAEDAELLDEMSNKVGDLIRDGKLDEAERAAQALLERFPEVHDGYDRLGMVCEAKGDSKRAAHY